MNVTGFLQCLSGEGFQTGNLLAYYDFSQTDGKVFFNQLYPTGQAYSGAFVNLTTTPGIILGEYYSVGGQLATQIGDFLNLTGLHCVFDFDFSGCNNTGQTQGTILLTNRSTDADISGFVLGINSSNRLFYENGGVVYTVNQELRNKNIISFSISQGQYVNLGVFDFENNNYVSETFTNQLNKGLSNLYLISYPSGSHSIYSGAMGNLKHFAILNDSLTEKDKVSNCMFCTGLSYVPQTTSGTLISVSGVILQNVYQSGVTGYQAFTASVLKEDGSTVPVVFTSGVSGVSIIGTQAVAVTTTGSGFAFTTYNPQLQYNQSEILGYSSFEAIFGSSLSGNNIEIYLYPSFQTYKNIPIKNRVLPYAPDSLNSNIYINGLLETNGIDYILVENEVVILGDSSLVNTISVSYSSNPVTVINYTGSGQFPINGSGQVIFSGFQGEDVYLNGQKLTSGQSYTVSSAAILLNSGVTVTGDEITFYPIDDAPNRFFTGVSSNDSILSGITGFSEQIWMNGVLQQRGVDYFLGQACFENYYFFSPNNPFTVYNNDGYYLIEEPIEGIIGLGGDVIIGVGGDPIIGF